MGSIQSMRSEALGSRALQDTNLQIANQLGSVHKSLGGQVTQVIDSLQGLISERTKAYDAGINKVKQSIMGKGGIGDQGVTWTFQLVQAVIMIAGMASNPSSVDVGGVLSALGTVTQVAGQATQIHYSIAGTEIDYEKAVSQLGYSSVDMLASGSDPSRSTGGAVLPLTYRDALMPRFKPRDPGAAMSKKGYVGTLFSRV